MCGGSDRFRIDNKEGRGTWICSHCGAGDGIGLVKAFLGVDFKEACKRVRQVLKGGVYLEDEQELGQPSADELRRERNALWKGAEPLTEIATDTTRYLLRRGFDFAPDAYPKPLRHHQMCPVTGVPGVSVLPAMLALAVHPCGTAATIHRTYLQKGFKASITKPKRVARGPFPPDCAVRLYPMGEDGRLCIAEGIETALAASRVFGMPAWAALCARNLEAFEPPEGCTALTIAADNDKSWRGQRAAYVLANRLADRKTTSHIDVRVELPPVAGMDWADEHVLRLKAGDYGVEVRLRWEAAAAG